MKGTKKKRARVPRGSAESAQASGQNFERARAAKNLWKTGYHKDKRTGYVERTSTLTQYTVDYLEEEFIFLIR